MDKCCETETPEVKDNVQWNSRSRFQLISEFIRGNYCFLLGKTFGILDVVLFWLLKKAGYLNYPFLVYWTISLTFSNTNKNIGNDSSSSFAEDVFLSYLREISAL